MITDIVEIKSLVYRYRHFIIVFIGIILLITFGNYITGPIDKLIFIYLFIAIAFKIDGRIVLGGGLILLLGTAFLMNTDEKFANQLATYAYYFLVIGVLQLFIMHIMEKEKKKSIQAIKEPGIDRKYHIIAIASGKGGVGKTSIAANLGIILSRLKKKITIIDMDLAMPNLEIITGLRNPPTGLIDVIEGRLRLEDVTYAGPEGVKIIPPGMMLEGYSKRETVEKIAELIKNLPTDNDYIILDMPPGREAIEVLSGDIGTLLVVNSDKPSILDAVNMKTLLERKGIKTLGVILNRHERDLEVIDEIEKVLNTKVVAVIPDSKIVKNAFNDEECFVVTKADSVPSRELEDLAYEILGTNRYEDNN